MSTASASPLQPVATLELDRVRSFSWTNSAIYRYGCLQLRPKGGYSTVVAMLWAALAPADAGDFPTPEHFAAVIPMEKAAEYYDAVMPKIMPTKEAIAKNGGGSTQKRTPASS